MFHNETKGEAVFNSDSNLSEQNEDLSDQVCESELKAMLDVKEESIPS